MTDVKSYRETLFQQVADLDKAYFDLAMAGSDYCRHVCYCTESYVKMQLCALKQERGSVYLLHLVTNECIACTACCKWQYLTTRTEGAYWQVGADCH